MGFWGLHALLSDEQGKSRLFDAAGKPVPNMISPRAAESILNYALRYEYHPNSIQVPMLGPARRVELTLAPLLSDVRQVLNYFDINSKHHPVNQNNYEFFEKMLKSNHEASSLLLDEVGRVYQAKNNGQGLPAHLITLLVYTLSRLELDYPPSKRSVNARAANAGFEKCYIYLNYFSNYPQNVNDTKRQDVMNIYQLMDDIVTLSNTPGSYYQTNNDVAASKYERLIDTIKDMLTVDQSVAFDLLVQHEQNAREKKRIADELAQNEESSMGEAEPIKGFLKKALIEPYQAKFEAEGQDDNQRLVAIEKRMRIRVLEKILQEAQPYIPGTPEEEAKRSPAQVEERAREEAQKKAIREYLSNRRNKAVLENYTPDDVGLNDQQKRVFDEFRVLVQDRNSVFQTTWRALERTTQNLANGHYRYGNDLLKDDEGARKYLAYYFLAGEDRAQLNTEADSNAYENYMLGFCAAVYDIRRAHADERDGEDLPSCGGGLLKRLVEIPRGLHKSVPVFKPIEQMYEEETFAYIMERVEDYLKQLPNNTERIKALEVMNQLKGSTASEFLREGGAITESMSQDPIPGAGKLRREILENVLCYPRGQHEIYALGIVIRDRLRRKYPECEDYLMNNELAYNWGTQQSEVVSLWERNWENEERCRERDVMIHTIMDMSGDTREQYFSDKLLALYAQEANEDNDSAAVSLNQSTDKLPTAAQGNAVFVSVPGKKANVVGPPPIIPSGNRPPAPPSAANRPAAPASAPAPHRPPPASASSAPAPNRPPPAPASPAPAPHRPPAAPASAPASATSRPAATASAANRPAAPASAPASATSRPAATASAANRPAPPASATHHQPAPSDARPAPEAVGTIQERIRRLQQSAGGTIPVPGGNTTNRRPGPGTGQSGGSQ